MAERIFTYDEASALIDSVRRKTLAADERLQQLRAEIDRQEKDSDRVKRLGEQINLAVQHWADEILELGALPKGLWTVDFDSGQGYFYCWSFNESALTHYHAYEDGFAGRQPLTDGMTPGFPGKKPLLN